MTRPTLLLIALFAYAALAFGLRTYLHWRRTGSTGFRGLSGRPGSAAWLGGVLLVVAVLATVLAPLLAMADVDRPIVTTTVATDIVAVAALVTGTILLVWSQRAMGASWRIGVDPKERTELVTAGPFGLVRNPIFSALLLSAAGFALLHPGLTAVASLLVLLAAIELQVRAVEEPYLRRAHAATYLAYARRVGRFFPGVGRAPQAWWQGGAASGHGGH